IEIVGRLCETPDRLTQRPTKTASTLDRSVAFRPACSLTRHRLLTIRNLTRRASALSNRPVMTAITVKRTIVKRACAQRSTSHRSFRELAQSYLASERSVQFAIEALLFAIIVAISTWPVFAAAGALHEFLQSAPV